MASKGESLGANLGADLGAGDPDNHALIEADNTGSIVDTTDDGGGGSEST